MSRKFANASALLNYLLDRCEAGTESPFAYPDYGSLPTIAEIDAFVKAISAAERIGGVAIVHATGRRRGEIKLVRLADRAALYAHLGRTPSREIADGAKEEMLEGLTIHPSLRETALRVVDAWSRNLTWCHIASKDVSSMRTALELAQAIIEQRHLGLDYRTFSRRITGNSKALERLEAAVLRLVGSVVDLPPGGSGRAILSMLGLERFGPPLLLSGALTLDGSAVSPSLPYIGIPPNEIERVAVSRVPAYVLTIENFASFNRHVIEADPERSGLVLYVGGYPSLATQNALRVIAAMLPADVPFFHWSDIDPHGTWIFRTIERTINRRLLPHLMSCELAEKLGEVPVRVVRLQVGEASESMISDLVDYFSRPEAKTLEQEEIDPIIPEPARHVLI